MLVPRRKFLHLAGAAALPMLSPIANAQAYPTRPLRFVNGYPPLFKTTTGTDMVHVPYRGGAALITDLIAGQVQGAVDALPNSLPHIRSGAVRALAWLSDKRSDVLPDLPTAAETVPGYEVRTWSGVGVPRGTPPEIIATLNREINAALADAAVQARLVEVGGTPIVLSAAAFGKLIADDTEKWAKVVKLSGAKPE